MASLFDTHAHLNSEEFSSDPEAVIDRAVQAGVSRMIVVGIDVATSRRGCLIAEARPQAVAAAVGIQPNYTAQVTNADWDEIVRLSEDRFTVAIGETGLDRYWNDAPFEVQQDFFDRHLRLSQTSGLPFIVHMRECEADVIAMLTEARKRGPLAGVMHSFTGSLVGAELCLALGLHVSFAGMVTYKKADDLRDIAAKIPDDRILIETDAPYLSPEPVRGKRPNEPAHLVHTAIMLAKLRGVSYENFARQTFANAESLFRNRRAS